jgi:mannosylglycoprotein endo-beta-mannosidase
MPGNKSPGPDGYTWEFYRFCWDVIKVDVVAAVRAIFSGRDRDLHCLNGALVALIPKKEGAVDLREFRPISLVHSFAKLMAKILALRLAPRMSELVDCSQSAFIQGRCIHDNFVLVRQSAVALHRRKLPALLIKLDVARAFDSVAWPFLISVLRQRSFGPRWVRWIISLLSSANTRVMINGAAGSKFRHGRGLRQGDPLSPLLFVLVMDVVAAMFRAAEARGVLSPLPAGLRHRVSLYTDDAVVFARPIPAELEAIRGILDCFGEASGLRVNLLKSSAAPIQCSQETLAVCAQAFPCPIKQLPCTYLGLPLSLKKLRKEDLQSILDKLARKLAFWKAKLLTKDGRVAFVQAVMTASVIYHLMALDVDASFLKAVDRLRRGFLWAGKHDARGGACRVAWQQVCQPKWIGGLGFHDLHKLNAALRARWLWFQWTDAEKSWAGLRFGVMPEAATIFSASVKVHDRDGARISFWEDP